MLVQYLVGLCCLQWGSKAVDVILGDDVLDNSTGTKRDVDVTVRVEAEGGRAFAFKAYEVKKEASPLDVAVVEQLAQKMADMESISHKAIVSTSGFTEPARSKARKHGVTLYDLKPWTKRISDQFPAHADSDGSAEMMFRFRREYLIWEQSYFEVTGAEMPASASITDGDSVYTKVGKKHQRFKTFGDFKSEVLMRSTEVLYRMNPARAVHQIFPIPDPAEGEVVNGPAWPHTHTMDTTEDKVHLQFDGLNIHLTSVTIAGRLAWQKRGERQLSYVMEEAENGTAFAGAIVMPSDREGGMTALVFTPNSRDIGIRFVQLEGKQLNMLRKISLS